MLPTHIKESNLVPDPNGRANHWHDPETDTIVSMPAGWKPGKVSPVTIPEGNGAAATNAEPKPSAEQKGNSEQKSSQALLVNVEQLPSPSAGAENKPAGEPKPLSENKTGSARKSSAKAQASTLDNSAASTAITATVLHEQYAGETREAFRALMEPKNRQEMCDLAQSVGIAGFLEMDKATLVESIIEAMGLKPETLTPETDQAASVNADQVKTDQAGSDGEALTEITEELEGKGVKILGTGYFGVVSEVLEDKSIRVFLTTGNEELLPPETKIRLMTAEEETALAEAARPSR